MSVRLSLTNKQAAVLWGFLDGSLHSIEDDGDDLVPTLEQIRDKLTVAT